jgi:hypothetical protein
MKKLLLAVSLLAAAGVQAAGGGGPDPFHAERDKVDPVLQGIQAAVAASDWPRARELAREGVAKNPGNAEYHNMYAYALRMGDKPQMDLVFKHYNEALRLEPRHRGAHEYLGEAYLMSGNLDKAKEQLRTLDKLCFFSCKEYDLLKKAIADYEGRTAAKTK